MLLVMAIVGHPLSSGWSSQVSQICFWVTLQRAISLWLGNVIGAIVKTLRLSGNWPGIGAISAFFFFFFLATQRTLVLTKGDEDDTDSYGCLRDKITFDASDLLNSPISPKSPFSLRNEWINSFIRWPWLCKMSRNLCFLIISKCLSLL